MGCLRRLFFCRKRKRRHLILDDYDSDISLDIRRQDIQLDIPISLSPGTTQIPKETDRIGCIPTAPISHISFATTNNEVSALKLTESCRGPEDTSQIDSVVNSQILPTVSEDDSISEPPPVNTDHDTKQPIITKPKPMDAFKVSISSSESSFPKQPTHKPTAMDAFKDSISSSESSLPTMDISSNLTADLNMNPKLSPTNGEHNHKATKVKENTITSALKRWTRKQPTQKPTPMDAFKDSISSSDCSLPSTNMPTNTNSTDLNTNQQESPTNGEHTQIPPRNGDNNSNNNTRRRRSDVKGVLKRCASNPEPAPTNSSHNNAADTIRYKLAVRTLSDTMMKRSDSITRAEHSFLHSLLHQQDQSQLPSVTELESANQVLETDPVFVKLRKVQVQSFEFGEDGEIEIRACSSRSIASDGSRDVPELIQDDSDSPPNKKIKTETSDGIPIRYDAWDRFKTHDNESNTNFHPFGQTPSTSFLILGDGTQPNDLTCHPRVLNPTLLESLQSVLPYAVSDDNFWLKYSLVRDGASLHSLLSSLRGSIRAILAIETVQGEVFGSFTSSTWRIGPSYYGSGEAFLWRLKRPRGNGNASHVSNSIHNTVTSDDDNLKLESDLEVFPWTQSNEYTQLCTHDKITIGGGDDTSSSPTVEPNSNSKKTPTGPGLTLEENLQYGTSASSPTFGNRPLSRYGFRFEIANVEAWTLTPCYNATDAETLELRKLFIQENRQ